ncbi:sialidase family protein [Georgenia sp. Z1344]|uniref:sialidase family protein n=1 Tax=Georgenia sp. Z1344 TaxID=3416706 RepID=UPI003CF490C1
MIALPLVRFSPSTHRRWLGLATAALLALVLALAPVAVLRGSPAAAAPADGAVRTFDDEPLGEPPADCRIIGDVTVAEAAFGGAAETNQAMRVVDQSSSVYTRAWCTYPQTEERSVSYRFSPAEFNAGPYVAIQGAEGTSANGVWRFTFNRDGDDIRIAAYDGSSFADVARVAGGAALNEWVDVTINATTERAEIIVNGVRFQTERRNAPSPTLGEIYFGSAGASAVGVDYYIDDLAVSGELPDDAFAGLAVEPLLDDFIDAGEVVDLSVARVQLPEGADVADYTAVAEWQGETIPAELTGPDDDGWATISISHTFGDGERGILRTIVTGPDGTESVAAQSVGASSRIQPDVIIAEGDGDERPFFPEVARLDDGRLVTVYYWSNGHSPGDGGDPGQIRWTESTDGGLTWSEPRVVIDTPDDDRDPQITQLRDGTIVLTWFQTDWTDYPAEGATIDTYVARSEDGGTTWSDPALVETSMSCGCGPRSGHYLLGWAAESGNVVELDNGDLLVPLYGTRPDAALSRASVVRSTDGGRTWPLENEVMIPSEPGVGLSEIEVAVLDDDHLTAVIRPGLVSESFDHGRTWSVASPVPWSMQAPDILTLPGGRMLLTYGGNDYGSSEPVVGRLAHPGQAWTDTTPVLLYMSRQNVDQGDPSSAVVSGDEYLTVSYDTNINAVVGTFSSLGDYPADPNEPEPVAGSITASVEDVDGAAVAGGAITVVAPGDGEEITVVDGGEADLAEADGVITVVVEGAGDYEVTLTGVPEGYEHEATTATAAITEETPDVTLDPFLVTLIDDEEPGEPGEPDPEPVPPSPGRGFYLNDDWDIWADHEFSFGRPGDEVLVGDWDGDGSDTLAVRRGNAYYLSNTLYGGTADVELTFGRSGDTVLVGDWDGDGSDSFAIRRGNSYFLTNRLTGGNAETELDYGRASDQVLVGDYDADSVDTFAVRRGTTYYVSNSLTSGWADAQFDYGRANDQVLVGDWDGDGADTFASRRGNQYLVSNTLTGGWADIEQFYGRTGDEVVVGDWNRDGTDTLGIRR